MTPSDKEANLVFPLGVALLDRVHHALSDENFPPAIPFLLFHALDGDTENICENVLLRYEPTFFRPLDQLMARPAYGNQVGWRAIVNPTILHVVRIGGGKQFALLTLHAGANHLLPELFPMRVVSEVFLPVLPTAEYVGHKRKPCPRVPLRESEWHGQGRLRISSWTPGTIGWFRGVHAACYPAAPQAKNALN